MERLGYGYALWRPNEQTSDGCTSVTSLTFFMVLPREVMRPLKVERISVNHYPRTHSKYCEGCSSNKG